MAHKMDFEYESAYRADSPLSYDVEEGELSSGSGRSSPGTVRDNASTCSTQTDDRITTMRELRSMETPTINRHRPHCNQRQKKLHK